MNVKQRLERRVKRAHRVELKYARFTRFCEASFGGKLEPWNKHLLLAYWARRRTSRLNGVPVFPAGIPAVGLLGQHADTIIIDDPWEG